MKSLSHLMASWLWNALNNKHWKLTAINLEDIHIQILFWSHRLEGVNGKEEKKQGSDWWPRLKQIQLHRSLISVPKIHLSRFSWSHFRPPSQCEKTRFKSKITQTFVIQKFWVFVMIENGGSEIKLANEWFYAVEGCSTNV